MKKLNLTQKEKNRVNNISKKILAYGKAHPEQLKLDLQEILNGDDYSFLQDILMRGTKNE